MFAITPYHETSPCVQGKEILKDIIETTGISKLWLSSDHVFLTTTSISILNSDLYVFDIVPQLKWRTRSTPAKQKDCVLDTNHELTVEVIWSKCEPSLIYVVSESGNTGIWEFLRPSNEWTLHKSFQLSNAKGARIIDVRLHEETCNLVWCERRGGVGEGTYCVCCRSICGNGGIKDEKWKAELGTTQAILHNCPAVEMFSFGDGICIHPCQKHLEKFCIFWSGRKDVKAVVFKDGTVEESMDCSSDFRDIAKSLVGSWSGTDIHDHYTILGMTVHPSSDDMVILNYNGLITKVQLASNRVKTVPFCRIKLPQTIFENIIDVEIFSNGLIFGLIDYASGVIFLYDIVSGKFLYKIEDFITNRYNVLNSFSAVPTTVFWHLHGFWRLEAPSLNEVVKTFSSKKTEDGRHDLEVIEIPQDTRNDSQEAHEVLCRTEKELTKKTSFQEMGFLDIAVWFSIYGLDHSAAVLLLQHVIAHLEAGMEIPKKIVRLLQTLSDKVFQNPSVLLGICDRQLSLEDDTLVALKHFLEELDQGVVPSSCVTPLNMKVQPFLRELFNVMSRLREVPSSVELSGGLSNGIVGAVVVEKGLQSVISGWVVDTNSLDDLEILCMQQPESAVQGFLPVDGEDFDVESQGAAGKVCAILRDELKDRRWKRRRNPDNAMVLATLFKLLYKSHPELLLDIIEVAKQCVSQGASKDETTTNDLEECIRDFTFEFLPSVWSEECDDLKRIKIHSHLLVRLELQQYAMQLLLQRRQWQQAVDLYIELSHRSVDQRITSQLYEMLLAAMLRGSGTSEKALLVRLFELKPEVIQMHDVFQLCLNNVPKENMEDIFDEHVLSVKEARRALAQFLPKT